MWPFREKPDPRPPSEYALAAKKSLAEEPKRWAITADGMHIMHDSGIAIDVWDWWISRPYIEGEPDSDEAVLRVAVHKWLALTITAPVEAKP